MALKLKLLMVCMLVVCAYSQQQQSRQNIQIQHSCNQTQKLSQRLYNINKQISTKGSFHSSNQYQLVKLMYSNLTKLGVKFEQVATCFNHKTSQIRTGSNRYHYELIPSINIYEGDSPAVSAILRVCQHYFTINGHLLVHFPSYSAQQHRGYTAHQRNFISSVRSQFTYFASASWNTKIQEQNNYFAPAGLQTQITKITIKKLVQKAKKLSLQQQPQSTIHIPLKYGRITGFANSFSLSFRFFAFSTELGYLLFYRSQSGNADHNENSNKKLKGKLQNIIQLSKSDPSQQQEGDQDEKANRQTKMDVRIVKLNNHLAVYTSQLNNDSFLYTVGTNGRNSTLKRFKLPNPQQFKKQQSQTGSISQQIASPISIQLKYNDNNWNEFYVKIANKIYVYDQMATNGIVILPSMSPYAENKQNKQNKQNGQMLVYPKHWYPLLDESDKFFISGNMLIIQSQYYGINIYYNITSGDIHPFSIPLLNPQPTLGNSFPSISMCSQSLGSHILCVSQILAYECYTVTTSDNSHSSSIQYTDYSKLRIPLVLVSLAIVIFISISRGKKKSNQDQARQARQQQQFMKQLQIKDKGLYQQLKRSKNTKGQDPNKHINKNGNAKEMQQPFVNAQTGRSTSGKMGSKFHSRLAAAYEHDQNDD